MSFKLTLLLIDWANQYNFFLVNYIAIYIVTFRVICPPDPKFYGYFWQKQKAAVAGSRFAVSRLIRIRTLGQQ